MAVQSDDVSVIRRQAKPYDVSLGYLSVWFPWSGQEDLSSMALERFCRQFGRSFKHTAHHLILNLGHDQLGDRSRQLWLVEQCIPTYHGKVTRIDLTIDVACTFDYRAYHANMVDRWKAAREKFEKVGLPILYDNPQGLTVYIGKRGNARLLRLYDKRAEIKAKTKDHIDIGFDLCRVELELHGKVTAQYLRLWKDGKFGTLCEDIAYRYNLPMVALDGNPVIIPRDCDDPDAKWRFVERYWRLIGGCLLENPRRFYGKVRVSYETR